jgi:hypothetical protein
MIAVSKADVELSRLCGKSMLIPAGAGLLQSVGRLSDSFEKHASSGWWNLAVQIVIESRSPMRNLADTARRISSDFAKQRSLCSENSPLRVIQNLSQSCQSDKQLSAASVPRRRCA